MLSKKLVLRTLVIKFHPETKIPNETVQAAKVSYVEGNLLRFDGVDGHTVYTVDREYVLSIKRV